MRNEQKLKNGDVYSSLKSFIVAISIIPVRLFIGILSAAQLRGLTALALTLFVPITLAAWQSPQPQSVSAYECTQVALEDVDEALLTKQERIALLDKSLTSSIDSYSTCVSTVVESMSGSGSGRGGAQAGTTGSDESNLGNEASSTAQATSGDETSTTPTGAGTGAGINNEEANVSQTANTTPGNSASSAPRGIIPPANNDKIICKLLYQEITKTQDADMIDGLTQQYKNYKCG